MQICPLKTQGLLLIFSFSKFLTKFGLLDYPFLFLKGELLLSGFSEYFCGGGEIHPLE